MGHFWCLFHAFLAVHCFLSTDAYITEEDKAMVLKKHNAVRRQISDGTLPGQPKSMRPLVDLTWDESLADLATRLAQSCNYGHGELKHRKYGQVGQNIAAYINNERGTQAFIDEHMYYDLDTQRCTLGDGKCGHYTQIVHEKTENIGCASNICSGKWKGNVSRGDLYLVCDYYPGGNVRFEEGGPLQKPYIKDNAHTPKPFIPRPNAYGISPNLNIVPVRNCTVTFTIPRGQRDVDGFAKRALDVAHNRIADRYPAQAAIFNANYSYFI